jgi:hypothetical protein
MIGGVDTKLTNCARTCRWPVPLRRWSVSAVVLEAAVLGWSNQAARRRGALTVKNGRSNSVRSARLLSPYCGCGRTKDSRNVCVEEPGVGLGQGEFGAKIAMARRSIWLFGVGNVGNASFYEGLAHPTTSIIPFGAFELDMVPTRVPSTFFRITCFHAFVGQF